MNRQISSIALIAALGGGAIVAQQPTAMAQEAAQTRSFDIRPQNLNGALLRFARDARVQVLYDTALVQGRQSPGARAGTQVVAAHAARGFARCQFAFDMQGVATRTGNQPRAGRQII